VGVDFATYHDQWLSEGFAEYAALWYLQHIRGDDEDFHELLRDYRDELTRHRETIYKSRQESRPIWLGRRTSSRTTPNEFALIVYKKGAWVLHMLRSLLMDDATPGDDRFVAMMQDFYAAHRGSRATTGDFERVVSRHFEEDMGWFFDQWIYGSTIPEYEFAHRIEHREDGQFVVRCRVDQRRVAPTFTMDVPIRLDLGDDQVTRLRMHVTGVRSELELPPMPTRPEQVTFNDRESVLCTVRNVDW
jgi:aminopeptidase N